MAVTVNIFYSGVNGNAGKFAEEMVHHASPMMAKIAELREKYDLHMRMERYLSDETGIPAADRTFVKE